MTTVASKQGLRAAATASRNKHAQRTPLPPRPGQIEAAKAPIDVPQYGKMTQPQLLEVARGLGLEPPKSAPKGKLLEAILHKERAEKTEPAPAPEQQPEQQPEPAPAPEPAAVADSLEPKGKGKADKFRRLVEPAGWAVDVSAREGGQVVASAVRGAEIIIITWVVGVFSYPDSGYIVGDRTIRPRNVSQALQLAARSPETAEAELKRVSSNTAWKRKVEAPKAPKGLPFDVESATDEEICRALVGRKLTWFNRHSSSTETAHVSINPRWLSVKEIAGERVVQFCSKDGGFRAARVTAITRVSR